MKHPQLAVFHNYSTANSSERVRLRVILQAKKMSKMLKIIQDYSKFISLSDQAAPPVTSSICKFLAEGVLAFPRLDPQFHCFAYSNSVVGTCSVLFISSSPFSIGGSREARGQSGHSRPPFSYGQVGKMVEKKKKRQKINRKQEIKFLVEILHL